MIAALWTAGVFWASGFVYTFFPGHELIPGLLSRVVACVLTAAGFVFFLRVLDYNAKPLPAALALPLNRMAGMAVWRRAGAGRTADGSRRWRHRLVWKRALSSSPQPPDGGAGRGGRRAAAVGALLEELTFRGYPFQKLTEACGAFWAVVVLSALFGAVHLGNPDAGGWLSWGFFNTLAVGVLFALARIRSGSLWFSFGLHFGWNLFQGAVFGLPVSGLSEFSTLVTASAHGSLALTGGAYGPEASATCSIVLVIALPLIWQLTRSRTHSTINYESCGRVLVRQ